MGWRKTRTNHVADVLRFIAWVFLAFDTILLAIFSFWFVGKFLLHLHDLLVRTVFSRPL